MGANLTAMDKQAIERAYKMFDTNGNGVIDEAEFISAMKEQGFAAPEKMVRFLFHIADRNGNGSLDKKEFVQFFGGFAQLENADIFDLIAVAADHNGDGKISQKELSFVIQAAKKGLSDHVQDVETLQKDISLADFAGILRQKI